MPAMGADMTEGTVVKWLKQEGDAVKRGDRLAEIETDKAVVDMEAYNDGLLRQIVVPEGRKVPVGQLIAFIGDPDDEIPEVEPAMEPSVSDPIVSHEETNPAPSQPAEAAANPQRVKASPIAKKLALERHIDLEAIVGSGPGGRITKQDVEQYVPVASGKISEISAANAQTATPVDNDSVPLSSMRQTIARVTVRSKTTAPHFYVTTIVDMTDAVNLRKKINETLDVAELRVSINDLIVKATALALGKYPKFNSFFSDDTLIGHADINIGIAMALEEGLIVPALMRCQNRSLQNIATAVKDLGKRARGHSGILSQEENSDATFSISNLGMFNVDSFSAIIVPPQSAVLATGSVTSTPIVRDAEVVVAEIMKATLSVDHRVADGAEAAIFLGEIQRVLENPLTLLL